MAHKWAWSCHAHWIYVYMSMFTLSAIWGIGQTPCSFEHYLVEYQSHFTYCKMWQHFSVWQHRLFLTTSKTSAWNAVKNFLVVCKSEPQSGSFSLTKELLWKFTNQQSKRSSMVSWKEGGRQQKPPADREGKVCASHHGFGRCVMAARGGCTSSTKKRMPNTTWRVCFQVVSQTVADCFQVASSFSKMVPPHTPCTRSTQTWIAANCPEFISKDEWPLNPPDLNTLDCHVWGAMFDLYQKYQPRPTNISELKVALQSIWNDLPQDPISDPFWVSPSD